MMNNTRIYFCLFWLSISSLFGQDNLEVTITETQRIPSFCRIIDGAPYHFKHLYNEGKASGTEIFRVDDGDVSSVARLSYVNDTLKCHHLLDMWQEDKSLFFLGYTYSDSKSFLSLMKYDEDRAKFVLLDSEEVFGFREVQHLFAQGRVIDGQRQYVYIDFNPNTSNVDYISRYTVVDGLIEVARHRFTEKLHRFFLNDLFYDNERKRYYINTGKYYLVFDADFVLLAKELNISVRDGIVFGGHQSFVLGKDGEDLVTYERRRIDKTNTILTERRVNVVDTFLYAEQYEDLNSKEDCYLVSKIVKDKYTYLHYSRSVIGNYDSNYGFNLLVFDKQGKLVENHTYESDRPIGVHRIDIDEQNKTVCGMGQYYDNLTGFSFTASFGTVHTENPPKETNILINNISRNLLDINPAYAAQTIQILDSGGRQVRIEVLGSTLDISSLSSGMYYIRMRSDNSVKTEKFVKI